MVVAGAGGDDAERNVGSAQRLQRVGDDAVTADDDQRVGALVERGLAAGGARASASVPAIATTSTPRRCNRAMARSAACGALPCPDAGLVSTVTRPICPSASAGSRNQLAGVEDSRRVQRRLDRAQHLHAEVADLVAHPRPVVGADGVVVGDGRRRRRRSRRDAAVLAVRHCSIGLPRCPATTVKYSDAPVGYTWEMWHSTSAGVPDSASAVRQRLGHGGLERGDVGPVGGRLERLAQRARRQQRVAQVGRAEPAVLPGAGRVLARAMCRRAAASSARVSACLLSAWASVPSNTVMRQAAAGDLRVRRWSRWWRG